MPSSFFHSQSRPQSVLSDSSAEESFFSAPLISSRMAAWLVRARASSARYRKGQPSPMSKSEKRRTWTVGLSRCRRVDDSCTDEQIDERLLVVIVLWAPDVGNIVIDAEDCECDVESASRTQLSAKTTHGT